MNGYGVDEHKDDPRYAIKNAIEGWTPTSYGFLAGPAFSIPYACVLLITGTLADFYNRTIMVGVSCICWSACLFGMSLANDMPTMITLRIFQGISIAFFAPAQFSLSADFFPKKYS